MHKLRLAAGRHHQKVGLPLLRFSQNSARYVVRCGFRFDDCQFHRFRRAPYQLLGLTERLFAIQSKEVARQQFAEPGYPIQYVDKPENGPFGYDTRRNTQRRERRRRPIDSHHHSRYFAILCAHVRGRHMQHGAMGHRHEFFGIQSARPAMISRMRSHGDEISVPFTGRPAERFRCLLMHRRKVDQVGFRLRHKRGSLVSSQHQPCACFMQHRAMCFAPVRTGHQRARTEGGRIAYHLGQPNEGIRDCESQGETRQRHQTRSPFRGNGYALERNGWCASR
jgi:hypothetical protein